MKETQVYAIGTIHGSKKSKNLVKNTLQKNHFDAILCEGVEGRINWKSYMWLKEPLLMLPLYICQFSLVKLGSEFSLAQEIANNKKIPFYNIDLTLMESINVFRKWYNYIFLLVVGILVLCTHLFPLSTHLFPVINRILSPIPVIILLETFYFLYFVWKIKGIRETSFIKKSKDIIKSKKYKKVLIICGGGHVDTLKKQMNIIDLT